MYIQDKLMPMKKQWEHVYKHGGNKTKRDSTETSPQGSSDIFNEDIFYDPDASKSPRNLNETLIGP